MTNRTNVSKQITLKELIIPFGEPDGSNDRRAAELKFPKDLTPEEIQHILRVTGWGQTPELVPPGTTLRAMQNVADRELESRRGLAGADAEQDLYTDPEQYASPPVAEASCDPNSDYWEQPE